ncbi:MAG: hypothetical protein DHS20C05_00880 [Hyphococcus sp.]|nr:MAG: hypothetical protein DHS20C05_00880 [Marinicaulis sp.]
MTEIIFVTCNEMPGLTQSDALVASALGQQGVSVSAVPWNGPQGAFAKADLIVMRSPWDYPSASQAFASWMEGLKGLKGRAGLAVKVVNSPSLMRWNLSKRYLLELAEAGAPLGPIRQTEPRADDIAEAMDLLGVTQAVVKPLMGATGSGLSLVKRDDRARLEQAAQKLAMTGLIQPLIPEITSLGETSMIFIDGEFTHAVVKRPKSGEILCQEEHGGTTQRSDPPDWALAEARAILSMLPEAPVYARVDAVIFNGASEGRKMRLMEVELIEPELFFNYARSSPNTLGAADRFAAALLKQL